MNRHFEPPLFPRVDAWTRQPSAPFAHLRTWGRWTIVAIGGEADLQLIPLLPDVKGCRHVVFDLRDVGFLDASALGSLAGRRNSITQAGGVVRLVARRPVMRLLEITRTSGAWSTFATLEEALNTPVAPPPQEGRRLSARSAAGS